jgi:uncharacterized protein (DUF1800 family)
MSLTSQTSEPRDAHYETDAALDHYFYHPNTAPFVATRLAQRFGVSNPSPGYMERIVAAFRSGSYSFSVGSSTITYVEMVNMATSEPRLHAYCLIAKPVRWCWMLILSMAQPENH